MSPSDKLAHYLLRSVNKAIRDYDMIADGDRIAVAVSGGKDSLTLLHLLNLRQRSIPEKFQVVAVHVTINSPGEMTCADMEVRKALEEYFDSRGQEYAFETIHIEAQTGCFRCSYLRRKALFMTAHRLGCNKIALGHHADDAAQTTLLNLIFHGKIETLYPTRQFFGGQFVLIRPMIYVPEKEIVRFAKLCGFPIRAPNCPRSASSRRTLARDIIHLLEQEYPKVKINLFRAGLRNETYAKPS